MKDVHGRGMVMVMHQRLSESSTLFHTRAHMHTWDRPRPVLYNGLRVSFLYLLCEKGTRIIERVNECF